MADIIATTERRLPYEIINIVFSFLGTSPSADLIKEAIEDIREYDDGYTNLLTSWKECVSINNKLNVVRKPKRTINITRNYLKLDNLTCEECGCNCLLDEYIDYCGKCEWCYTEYLGHEVFTCGTCRFRSDDLSDFSNNSNGFWCQYCEPEYSSGDENEESDFWEEDN